MQNGKKRTIRTISLFLKKKKKNLWGKIKNIDILFDWGILNHGGGHVLICFFYTNKEERERAMNFEIFHRSFVLGLGVFQSSNDQLRNQKNIIAPKS